MNGRPWTEEEHALLRQWYGVEGKSKPWIAARLRRTVRAIQLRCSRMGVILPREVKRAILSDAQQKARRMRLERN